MRLRKGDTERRDMDRKRDTETEEETWREGGYKKRGRSMERKKDMEREEET